MSATGAAAGAAPSPTQSASHPSIPGSDPSLSLSAFWQQHAFTLGGIDFQQIDVALAAMVFGEWARFEKRLAEGLACAARVAAENQRVPTNAVEDAAISFRYERDLISGADIADWLDRSGLSAEAWMSYITRQVLREAWNDELEDILDRYAPSPRQLEAAALTEGICSRLFDDFEQAFAGRAAIAFERDATVFESRVRISGSHGDAATRLARQHAHWFDGRSSADVVARLRVILDIQDSYGAAADALLTDGALQQIVETYRLEWVVIDTDTLSFSDESAAREALLCVNEDRLSLADIGELSRHKLIRTHGFLDDVPSEHRHRLLAAEPGRVIGPLLVDGQYQVTMVTGRSTPTLDDAHVADRARTMFLDQIARRAAREHVARRRVSS